MNRPEIVLIVARADNGVIGVEGHLPWHIPADLRRFKQLTTGAPMIMGRKTYDALPSLFQDRRHIVLTKNPLWQEEGVEQVSNIEQALSTANAPRVSVIGGQTIFDLFRERADRVELTEVHIEPLGNTVLEPFDVGEWEEVKRESFGAEDGRPAFDFVTLLRRRTP